MKNVHIFKENFDPKKVLLLSDIHWDNPKCDRVLLKRHLDQAMEMDARICMNGDTLCLMQGRADRRGSKSGIRPEHNVDHYFDAVVNDAIEWFSPYAKNIDVISYGNHESAIIKHQEIDVIQRLVGGLNQKNGTHIQTGGYGGWIVYNFKRPKSAGSVSYRIKYYHGSGGGGPVTKGTIQFNRMATMVEGADMVWMGHVHEDHELTYQVERMNHNNYVHLKEVLMVRTATYKEEYGDEKDGYGAKGWMVERGSPPKPLGGRWLNLEPIRQIVNGHEEIKVQAYTYRAK